MNLEPLAGARAKRFRAGWLGNFSLMPTSHLGTATRSTVSAMHGPNSMNTRAAKLVDLHGFLVNLVYWFRTGACKKSRALHTACGRTPKARAALVTSTSGFCNFMVMCESLTYREAYLDRYASAMLLLSVC